MRFLLPSLLLLTACASQPPAVENVTLQPETREQIRSTIYQNRKTISDCYGQALLKPGNEKLAGRVTMNFKLSKTGTASQPQTVADKTSIQDSDLVRCIGQQIETWQFPSHNEADTIDVVYPFVFRDDTPQNMQQKLDRFEKLKK